MTTIRVLVFDPMPSSFCILYLTSVRTHSLNILAVGNSTRNKQIYFLDESNGNNGMMDEADEGGRGMG